MQVREADGTVLFESGLFANVVVEQLNRHADAAVVTMESVFTAPDPADAALLAMKYLFRLSFIVVKNAYFTKVSSKLLLTTRACLGWRLLCLAN